MIYFSIQIWSQTASFESHHEIFPGPFLGMWLKTASTACLSSAIVAVLVTTISVNKLLSQRKQCLKVFFNFLDHHKNKEKRRRWITEARAVQFEDGEPERLRRKLTIQKTFPGENAIHDREGRKWQRRRSSTSRALLRNSESKITLYQFTSSTPLKEITNCSIASGTDSIHNLNLREKTKRFFEQSNTHCEIEFTVSLSKL